MPNEINPILYRPAYLLLLRLLTIYWCLVFTVFTYVGCWVRARCTCFANNVVVVGVIGLNLYVFNRRTQHPDCERRRHNTPRSCVVRRKACRFSFIIIFYFFFLRFFCIYLYIFIYLFTVHFMSAAARTVPACSPIRRVVCVCLAVYKCYYSILAFRFSAQHTAADYKWALASITIFTRTKLKWNCRRCVSFHSVCCCAIEF